MQRLSGRGFVAEIDDSSYILTKPPESIPLDEVLQLFADFSPPSYDRDEPDALDRVLEGLDDTIRSKSRSITFADLT